MSGLHLLRESVNEEGEPSKGGGGLHVPFTSKPLAVNFLSDGGG